MGINSRIGRLVRKALPKGRPAKIIWRRTGFRDSETLRVVTPAWRTLSKDERIEKLERAIEPNLRPKERAHIFRISVLTPAEFKRLAKIVPARVLYGNARSNGLPKKHSRQPRK